MQQISRLPYQVNPFLSWDSKPSRVSAIERMSLMPVFFASCVEEDEKDGLGYPIRWLQEPCRKFVVQCHRIKGCVIATADRGLTDIVVVLMDQESE